ncbi:MAG: T9SS type A sorting domain-containing protein [Lewinellaceae bacterium]|nr:T9SS type A sorting domain-containing protein [Lewinellaceae bacterium]
MKRFIVVSATLALLGGLLYSSFFYSSTALELRENDESSEQEHILEALEYENRITQDPALGYPPLERLAKALKKTKELQQYYAGRSPEGILESHWRERGPNNIGGRTRVIHIDLNGPERKAIWAGGVSGGLWKTDDITASRPEWYKVDDYLDNISIGALAQDPNEPDIFYLGTGELYGGISGFALFRSENGGKDWAVLPATTNGNFQFTQALFVHPQTGDVYAGTTRGLYRSNDRGGSWQKVLGAGAGAFEDAIHDMAYHKASGTIYVSTTSNIFKSASGDLSSWENLTAGTNFTGGFSRVEIAVSQGSPHFLYAVGNSGGNGSGVHRLAEGSTFWDVYSAPISNDGENWTRGQGGYDLEIEVDPFNGQRIIIGGIDLYVSENGGFSFNQLSDWTGSPLQFVHADQHKILFDEEKQGVAYFGNDGGFFRTFNGGGIIQAANTNYNVTQFYAADLHPESLRDYFIGGTQDNGSLQLSRFGIVGARTVGGGDGFYAHIDQDEPLYQLISLYYGDYSLSIDGGASFGTGVNTDGGFVNPSDYDDEANILYAQTNTGDFYRWNRETAIGGIIDIAGQEVSVTHVRVDPNVPNRVYLGAGSGRIFRIDDAHLGNAVNATVMALGSSGSVSSIDIERGNPDHLLATLSNYGVTSVYESTNGGQSWTACEGNLPDMPVRWGIFNPNDASQAIIATELGVWATAQLTGSQTEWVPPVPGTGIPLTRVSMLQARQSDKVVLAATYGRGLWTSDLFSDPIPAITGNQVHYTQSPLVLSGVRSLQAESFEWEFGDGTTASGETVAKEYNAIGEYDLKMTINGAVSTTATIKILPSLSLPYTSEEAAYGGGFEGHPEQYGVHTISGSSWERGRSSVSGKSGVNSGDNAFVIGLDEEYYQPNTETYLYLPDFDFSDPGIYEFSFWAKYSLQSGFDGFQVQYSTNRGQSWKQLGAGQDSGWYPYTNESEPAAAFPLGASYFSGTKASFDNFTLNISSLAGQEHVAFRFVFRSENTGNHSGVAIDDVKVTKFGGDLKTQLLSFEGDFSSPSSIRLEWTTQPEYNCRYFEVERSYTGKAFETIGQVNAKGVLSTDLHAYTFNTDGDRLLYFFRLRVVNDGAVEGEEDAFYSSTIAIRKESFYSGKEVLRVFPNPFGAYIEATFTDVMDDDVFYELYDMSGRLVLKGTQKVTGPLMHLEMRDQPTGVYLLSLRVGPEGEERIFKLLAE